MRSERDASTAPSVEAKEISNIASTDGAVEASKGGPVSGNRPRQRHWENRGQPGQLVFVTTKCLDWAPIFSDPLLADRMVQLLFQIYAFHNAALHAYVVMPDHLHFLCRLPHDQTDRQFIGRFKSYSEDQLHSRISHWQEKKFDEQRGLNRRYFWARSFRSLPILTDVFWKQKVHYIHWNPVRRELCQDPEQYIWSSARLFAEGNYQEENGLMDLCPQFVASMAPSIVAKERSVLTSTDGAVEASDWQPKNWGHL